MALRITSRNERGVVEYCGKSSDLSSLPLKGISQGSSFFDIETSEVYMFIENETSPNLDGSWVTI